MFDFTKIIFEAIKTHGITSIIIAGLIEQVVVPIPSPLVPMAAGFLFVPKEFLGVLPLLKEILFKAAIPFSIGSTIGSTMVYLIAWFGGKWLIEKFHKWFDFEWHDIERIKEKYFHGKFTDELLIFVFRAIPVVPSSLISAVCGAIRIRPFDFYFFTWLGLLVRGMLLGWLGWQSGEALFAVSKGLDRWEMILSMVILGVAGLLLLWAYSKRKKWLASLRK